MGYVTRYPSQHDGKDAAMVAELVAHGKGRLWPYSTLSESQQILRHQVLRMDAYSKLHTQWLGRLEALVARHWPELTDTLKLSSVTIQSLLATYGSAAKAHADPQLARQLRLWGKQYLEEEKLQHIVSSASTTKGLPMTESECLWMQEIATEVLKAHRVHLKCVKVIETQIANDPVMERYRATLSGATLAVIWSEVGDPGLNLKERSSGRRTGQLAISKRGPALSRRWIYFWALRAIQRDELKGWYSKFIQAGKTGASDKRRKMKAMIAMMRKLCKSLWHVRVNDKNFDYALVISNPSTTAGRRRRRRKAIGT
jgi:transposase